jgi:glycosyltransferase involved in cell wall biosynthesis
MKTLFIAYYYLPMEGAGVTRAVQTVKSLSSGGNSVSVLTHSYCGDRTDDKEQIRIHDPSFNLQRKGVRRFSWLGHRLRSEILCRLDFYSSIYGAWGKRALLQAQRVMDITRPDVILATYPPAEDLEIGLYLATKFKRPLVVEFRDGLVFEPVSRRAMGFRAVRRKYQELEAAVAREAAAVITVSPPLSRYFQEQLGCRLVATIPNGYDALPPLVPLKPDPFSPGFFHVVHTGKISLSDRECDLAPWVQGVGMALAACPDLCQRLRLHFAGSLSRRERRLLRPLAAAGIARLYGSLPRETALWMQRRADLLLLLTSGDRTSVATAKLFEYMQAARPVLAMTSGTFAADIIRGTGIGWTTPPGDPQKLSTMLKAIMEGELSPPQANEAAIARYDRKYQSRVLLSLLDRAGK